MARCALNPGPCQRRFSPLPTKSQRSQRDPPNEQLRGRGHGGMVGNQGEAIFGNDRDRVRFLETFEVVCRKTAWRVQAYGLMQWAVGMVVRFQLSPSARLGYCQGECAGINCRGSSPTGGEPCHKRSQTIDCRHDTDTRGGLRGGCAEAANLLASARESAGVDHGRERGAGTRPRASRPGSSSPRTRSAESGITRPTTCSMSFARGEVILSPEDRSALEAEVKGWLGFGQRSG